MTPFNCEDLKQIKKLGIDVSIIEKQLENFKNGFPFVNLVSPATVKNGIVVLDTKQLDVFVDIFDKGLKTNEIIKFVPASGAASRMFKDLFTYIEKCSDAEKAEEYFFNDKGFNAPYNFIVNIENFAFYKLLNDALQNNGTSILECQSIKDFKTIIEHLLLPIGLDYAALPKGLLHFHLYNDYPRTSMEEHLVEGALYCKDKDGVVNIHFTVSPEHMDKFKEKFDEVKAIYQEDFKVKFKADFSIQKSSTDTISADANNEPFRDNNGLLVFRPGGHGALIENLNDLKADIVFIKNIDNVVPDALKDTTIQYKKAIGGLLLDLQRKIFDNLKILENRSITIEKMNEIAVFAENDLFLSIDDFKKAQESDKRVVLFNLLNRPIRVCGMVKNQGEPGGGPFWIENENGQKSLQIIESSQINLKDELQLKIFKQATHFNPVDLVCGIKDYQGNRFNLLNYVDPKTGFISIKSKDGKELKAQELPGLWNGAMADWITIFVEVPLITFNPVKTVNDLLREEHQNK